MVIVVPPGDTEDRLVCFEIYNPTYEYLKDWLGNLKFRGGFSTVWKKLFHGVENFWRKGGRRVEFFHGVENFFPWRGKAGLELAEGEVAVDFIDGAVAVYVQDGVGEGGGEFFAQAADDFGFEFFADAGRHGVEGGDAGLDDVAGAVLRADADGEGGADVEEAVVFAVGGVAVGGTVGVAAARWP